MIAQARPVKRMPVLSSLAFAAGVLVLLATGFILYWWISIGAEALLVPWHCECTWDTRPALGTAQRTLNDFFAASGRGVPSFLFMIVTGMIVALRTWRAKNRTWLPLLFSIANVLFLTADLIVTVLAGSLSDWVVGSRAGRIDAGYHRTWYGIAATCILWIVYWLVLLELPIASRAVAVEHVPADR